MAMGVGAVSAGANIKVLQKMLGHKSAAMTLDIYADLLDEGLDTVAVRLDDAARRGRGSVGHKSLEQTIRTVMWMLDGHARQISYTPS